MAKTLIAYFSHAGQNYSHGGIRHLVAETQPTVEIETPDDGTEYLDITGQYISYDTSDMAAPEDIEVLVTAENLLWVYLLGIVICAAAVILASLPVVKLKPKISYHR